MTNHESGRARRRLCRELDVIRGAVEAARILGEAVATSQLGPERDHHRAPRAIIAVLSLVEVRLRKVRREVRVGRGARPHEAQRAAPTAAAGRLADGRVLEFYATRLGAAGPSRRL